MSIYNAKKRQKLINKFLKTLNLKVDNRNIIIRQEDLIFLFHLFQTNIEIFLAECFQCPLDCNKFIELYLGEAQLDCENITELEKEDLILLAKIKEILNNNLPLESETIKTKLRRKIHLLNFGLIGYDQVGKSTLFEMIPGKPKKVENLTNTYVKEITSFSPLLIKLYDYGTQVMENFISNSPAPLLLKKLGHFYLYIVVTDSSTQNVIATKNQILPKLKKLSPYAAIIVIANKQNQPNKLSVNLIEKILENRTYPISAIIPENKEFFNQLLNEVILLRQEQIQEFNCPFIK